MRGTCSLMPLNLREGDRGTQLLGQKIYWGAASRHALCITTVRYGVLQLDTAPGFRAVVPVEVICLHCQLEFQTKIYFFC